MGKASSSKKVQRAASTGGGRTSRGRRPIGYYSFILLVALLGGALILVSRDNLSNLASAEPPTTDDHWHQAYGIYLCDAFVPNLLDQGSDKVGIHTHEDGLIHIHPFTNRSSGKGATLGKFADQVGIELEADRLKVPGQDEKEDGDKCGKEKGRVRLVVWDSAQDDTAQFAGGDPQDYRLVQNGVVVIAFVPEDTEASEIPKPASIAELASPSDLEPTPSSVPEGTTGESTTTTAPAATDSTTGTSAP